MSAGHGHVASVAGGAPAWVAIVALVVSLALLAWNVLSYVVRLPRLHVFIREHVIGDINDAGELFIKAHRYEVVAINPGGEALTIWDVGLSGSPHLLGEPYIGASALMLTRFGSAHLVIGPDLPARLEGHGAISWWFEDEASRTGSLPGDTVWGFAERYRVAPWWYLARAALASKIQVILERLRILVRFSRWLARFGYSAKGERVRRISRSGLIR